MYNRAFSFGVVGLFACLLLSGSATFAQNKPAGKNSGADDNFAQRIHRQMVRINMSVKSGTLDQDQANKLRAEVQSLQAQVQAKRRPDGSLTKEDKAQFETLFNQNSNMIQSMSGAGVKKAEGGSTVGPAWKAGKDGAQDPKALLKEMKAVNRRQLRQERQALEQKIEQQQLDYEHQMIPELANQKKGIMNGKQELKDIRKEQNAN